MFEIEARTRPRVILGLGPRISVAASAGLVRIPTSLKQGSSGCTYGLPRDDWPRERRSSILRLVRQGLRLGFPIPAAIEVDDPNLGKAAWIIEAPQIHTEPVRIRAWHIERLHPAYRTKQVLRRPGVEAVARQLVLTRTQAEP